MFCDGYNHVEELRTDEEQILEMYHSKVGFGPGEQLAIHTRRRYRLHPNRANPQGQNPDPSMWLVHYSLADPADRIPSNVIPVDMRQSQIMGVRGHLQQQGQIVQKDFMLHDRPNWPQIAFPRGRPQGQQPMYSAGAPPQRIPQAMAYPPQHQPGPPAKRARPNAAAAAVSNTAAVLDIDDEEDTSRGDLFDHFTPREISVARYKQNHEWMEEILSSPYAMHQLEAADLGLGLKGQLSSLTAEFFHAPVDPDNEKQELKYVGRLDPVKAEEFRKRTHERVAKENKEIEKMKARHERRMGKFQKGKILDAAEKDLRTAVHDPESTGPEIWRLEGRVDEESNEDDLAVKPPVIRVSDIVAKVEASLGRHTKAVEELIRIQAGGYEEPVIVTPPAAPPPQLAAPVITNSSNGSDNLVGDNDIEMGNSAGGMLDQFHTGLSTSHPTPGSNNFPTPQGQFLRSATGTPGLPMGSPAAQVQHQPPPQQQFISSQQAQGGGDNSDWVVVPPGGRTPSPNTAAQQQPQNLAAPSSIPPQYQSPQQQQQPQPQEFQSSTSNHASPSLHPPTNPPSTTHTPSALQTSTTPTALQEFHASSPNDFADLGDLDTAGDALAGYGDEMDVGGGDGEVADFGMGELGDDSAFGEAFHGTTGNGDGGEGAHEEGL